MTAPITAGVARRGSSLRRVIARVRLVVFAAIGGALTGLISYAFLESLDWATRTRIAHGWLVWLLPAVGLAVGAVYHYLGGRAKGGTPAVIEQGHLFTHGVPARMAPLIFGGSIAGHLAGASVGREGAALQMAGSVTDTAARFARLPAADRRTLIASSLAGGWGAVFGVPITGVVFMLHVTRRHSLQALLPAVVAAFTGQFVVDSFGYHFGDRPQLPAPDWTIGLPFKLILAGAVFGLVGRTFVWALHVTRSRVAHVVKWPPARPIVGAVATLALMLLVGRDYLGLSLGLLDPVYAGGHVDWWVPLLKMLFTVIALGTGFVGGEVLPLFVMGGTMGGALAPGLHVPTPMLAATGASAAFSSAAGVMFTGVVLTVEQFGWHTLLPALIVCIAARVAAGKPGLYVTHH
ncbi:chloride channel protein [Brevundimonas sp.]|uniref:chloride channel protein n=1 Tax=Brevundimonas sp. TaxID=1871086 RepID=UPI00272F912D|nr:chloride channel protein [Brevundimonas sp.]MDP1912447.1 chloride channel protein [Brevundimonas sp.]